MKKIIEALDSLVEKLPIPLMFMIACSIATTIMTLLGGTLVLIWEAIEWLASQWS